MKTKTMFFLGLFAAASFLASCEERGHGGCFIPQPETCFQKLLAKHGMAVYNGEELGCKTYLQAYRWKDKDYFMEVNHCADMSTYPFDCDGNELCKNAEDADCAAFYKDAVKTGILGITK